jgi:hypothetical protein
VFEKNFQAIVRSLRRLCPDVFECLFHRDHDLVVAELASKSLAALDRDDEQDANCEWTDDHTKVFLACGLRRGALPTNPDLENNAWLESLPNRQKEIVELRTHTHGLLWTGDISQKNSRVCGMRKLSDGTSITPTLLPKTQLLGGIP